MAMWVWVVLAVVIVVGGAALFIVMERRSPGDGGESAPAGVADMGYGAERWVREHALWSGILRRLEIQAKYQSPISDRLQAEIEAARAKVAEAEKYIKKG